MKDKLKLTSDKVAKGICISYAARYARTPTKQMASLQEKENQLIKWLFNAKQ